MNVLHLIASIVSLLFSREHASYEVESARVYTQQLHRRDEMLTVLHKIGRPDLPSGEYSDTKKQLWEHYHALDQKDESLKQNERAYLAGLRYE